MVLRAGGRWEGLSEGEIMGRRTRKEKWFIPGLWFLFGGSCWLVSLFCDQIRFECVSTMAWDSLGSKSDDSELWWIESSDWMIDRGMID